MLSYMLSEMSDWQ